MELQDVPVGSIDPDPDNVRGKIGDVDELAASIKAQGILEPLLVSVAAAKRGKPRWSLIAGHRRLAAAKKAGLADVPCLVRDDLDAAGRLEAQLVENLHRSDLNAVEEARGYHRLGELGVGQRSIATKVGRSQSHVSKRLTLLKLPAGVLADVAAGDLPVADALALVPLAQVAPDRVAKVARRPDYQSVADCVKEQLAAVEADDRAAKAKGRLEADGIAVVKLPSSWFSASIAPLKMSQAQLKADERDGFSWAPGDHVFRHADLDAERAEGHLAAVITKGGRIVYVCTKPAAHDRKTKAGKPRETAAERRRRLEDEQRAVDAARRVAFIVEHRDHFTEVAFDGDMIEVVAAHVLVGVDAYLEDTADAAAILGLDVDEASRAEAIVAWEQGQLLGLVQERLLAATVLKITAMVHNDLASTWHNTTASPVERAVLELLVRMGYELSETESDLITPTDGTARAS